MLMLQQQKCTKLSAPRGPGDHDRLLPRSPDYAMHWNRVITRVHWTPCMGYREFVPVYGCNVLCFSIGAPTAADQRHAESGWGSPTGAVRLFMFCGLQTASVIIRTRCMQRSSCNCFCDDFAASNPTLPLKPYPLGAAHSKNIVCICIVKLQTIATIKQLYTIEFRRLKAIRSMFLSSVLRTPLTCGMVVISTV